MASTYTISDGTGRVEISNSSESYIAVQVVSDSALDSAITVKLQHSSNDANYEDLANTSTAIASGENTILIESFDFVLDSCFLYVDVASATLGTLDILVSSKKKEDSSVDATITGTVDANITNDPLNTTETSPVLTTPNFDAFGRLRVSQVNSQADLKQIYDELPLFYDIEEVGTGSHSYVPNTSESTMTVTANNDAVIMQTKQRFNYSSGKSSLMLITFRNFDTETKVIKRVGYFNTNTTTPFDSTRDGMYLEITKDGEIRFVIEKTGTKTTITQSNWDDPMDGTGASGVDLQLGTETGNLLMWIDYEWLGVGEIRFGFIKDGTYYIANKKDHIGSNGVYMTSPNHSIRAEIRRSGTVGSGGSFTLICSTYGSEGTVNSLGKILSDNMGSTHVDANSTANTYALMGVRLGSSYLDTLVDVLGFSILAITNDSQRWELWLNPTVAGTFTYSAVNDSSMETAKGSGSGNTVTTTGATLIDSGYISSNTSDRFQIESAIRLGASIAGVSDEMVLCTTPLSSNSDVIASLTWREVS